MLLSVSTHPTHSEGRRPYSGFEANWTRITSRAGRQRIRRTMEFLNSVTLCLVFSFIALSRPGVNAQLADRQKVIHNLDSDAGRPSGVVWVVQLSDLHISVFKPERAEALQKMMGTILRTIQPSLVLVTGDLTDAKSKSGTSTQQYEEEWITYKDSIDFISKESGIPLKLFYDLRGNHDKYGVPYANSSLDYYSRYSCNARLKRTGLVQSITLMDNIGRKNLLVGVDDSMNVGLRGPSNLFGHPSDSIIADLDRELSHWDGDALEPVTKIVFGHFPTSFTASSETGQRSEQIMAKHNISAYICGHLHCKFGRQLYKHHVRKGLGEFWEWEMGDWRVNRMMRVLAIDHGRVSFVDVDWSGSSKDVLSGKDLLMPTVILPTNPLDSRVMLHSSTFPHTADAGTVRALVFSRSQPTSVTAIVFDSKTLSFVDYVVMAKLKMDLVSEPLNKEQGGPHFYEAVWESQNFTGSATRYWLQIQVNQDGVITTSSMWPFSVEGKNAPFSLPFLGYIALEIEWEAVYPVILWTIIFVIFGGFLLLPRLVFLYLEKKGTYETWVLSVLTAPSDGSFPYFKLPCWALLEGARNRPLWWGQVFYFLLLLAFPWFWGRVLADDYPVGYMTLWGWTVRPSKGQVASQSGLGWPDIMGIVLPYFCGVVLPLVLMVSALCAEQAYCHLDVAAAAKPDGSAKKINGVTVNSNSENGIFMNGDARNEDSKPLLGNQLSGSHSAEELDTPSEEEEEESQQRATPSFLHRKVRKLYFVVCFAIAFLHFRLCMFLASAYGLQSIILSPIYGWAVPTLLVAAIFSTSSLKPKILHVN